VCAVPILTLIATGTDRPPQSYKDSPEILRGSHILWHDPGAVERLDLRYGAEGASGRPLPPFVFVKEDTSGTNPNVLVRDASGRQWDVKVGEEARPDTFCSRLVWAMGYFVESNYFVPGGSVEGVHDLKRARTEIDEDGRMIHGARFQLRSKDPEYL